jgi:uncharacterized repeat protein (TIGR01451 family)
VLYEDEYGNTFPMVLDCDINDLSPLTLIGDYVWNDSNENGIQESGEPGIENVVVNLLNSSGVQIATTTTNSSGYYEFRDQAPGDYIVEFTLPEDYYFTARDQGSDDNLDSDADPDNGRTNTFTLHAGDYRTDLDAGLVEKKVSDLGIEKTVSDEYVQVGEEFFFTLVVTHHGGDPAEDVQIMDDLPPGLEFISANPTQDSGPNPLIWTIPLMNPGDQVTIRINVRATDVLGGMDNNSFVSSENRDPDMSNNSSSDQVHVLVPIELSSFTVQVVNGLVQLQWTTQSENNNMGYNLYRSEDPEGTFTRINPELIPGAGNSEAINSYRYVDDSKLVPNKKYYYKLASIDFDGKVKTYEPVGINVSKPSEYSLDQNYPNPFNMETRIRFHLKETGNVELVLYNMKGQEIHTLVSSKLDAGVHSIVWNGTDDKGNIVPSGTYLYTLRVNGFEQTQKLVLLK